MTAIARRLAICTVALGTIALAACAGDPVSPKSAKSSPTLDIFNNTSGRTGNDTTTVRP